MTLSTCKPIWNTREPRKSRKTANGTHEGCRSGLVPASIASQFFLSIPCRFSYPQPPRQSSCSKSVAAKSPPSHYTPKTAPCRAVGLGELGTLLTNRYRLAVLDYSNNGFRINNAISINCQVSTERAIKFRYIGQGVSNFRSSRLCFTISS